MRRASELGLGLLLVALLAGCGGDEAEETPLSVGEMGSGLSGAMCSYLYRCVPLFESISGQSESECATSYAATVEDTLMAQAEAAIGRGTVTFDGLAARGCLDAARASSCDDGFSPAGAACDQVFVGSVALGDSCRTGIECAGDTSCVLGLECPGVCTANPAAGESCEFGGASCVDGTQCVGDFDDAHCMPEVALGGSCGADTANCAGNLTCEGDSEGQLGSCAREPLLEAIPSQGGEDCGEEATCAGGLFCKLDLIALQNDELAGTCAVLPESGGACDLGFPRSCPQGEWCDFSKGAEGEGLCTTLPGHGQPCADGAWAVVLGPGCAAGTQCVMVDEQGTFECRSTKRLGESCTWPSDCHSGSCEEGACVVDECSGD